MKLRSTMKTSLALFLVIAVVMVSHSEGANNKDDNNLTEFWARELPATPMPAAIRNYLNPSSPGRTITSFNSSLAGADINIVQCKPGNKKLDTQASSLFLLEKNLKVGIEVEPSFPEHLPEGRILSRRVVQREFPAPLHSNLEAILDRFSVNPTSREAQVINATIEFCENAWKDENTCATSLEDMVEFTVASLGGNRLRSLSTTMSSPPPPKQRFKLVSLKRVGEENSVVTCHKASYPYAVFLCHNRLGTVPYTAKLVGQRDGSVVEAALVCHKDTSEWDPRFPGLVALNAKPGVPVCHFLNQVSVLWVTRRVHK